MVRFLAACVQQSAGIKNHQVQFKYSRDDVEHA